MQEPPQLRLPLADLEIKIVTIDDAYVTKMLAEIVKNEDLSRYIL